MKFRPARREVDADLIDLASLLYRRCFRYMVAVKIVVKSSLIRKIPNVGCSMRSGQPSGVGENDINNDQTSYDRLLSSQLDGGQQNRLRYRRFNGAYNTAFCDICNISPAVENANENPSPSGRGRRAKSPRSASPIG